ncbi:MAG: hypothetical protein A2887_01055 [Alphaproteobacteria bacterium RIFCSPLOWO2_01_FULL_40_26]|nr:MAG: hypothetical protein A3D15_04290 [Alphaproteobacteria bacterium RIFCSPHIGHO2_02_FULL_40_34]OFW87874.1 MAG: hypothetical protein A2794_00880 [Alphaproteobacteria bacterium RIFCSPHIGHO2_01_FULL_40_8]OFW95057.1 MAG: hypothetical protein A2887_01055 [Alphaproteobacteria bacterium RIFCSPLOWO2_01_FULL_40_26]OFX10585.1 MAG: hypothetical protein A3H30_03020 [Alphaproteobacteria bacterium RIFCSPLOWO2_02_FULL_40_19]OFX12137.1 MAG: hypothetical protein A3G22_00530 [Alphaproteobacteria bacterium RI
MTYKLSMGPVLFNWDQEKMEKFYQRVANESVIDDVYIGDVICSKRASWKFPFWQNILEDLKISGKRVIFSTPSIITNENEINSIKKIIIENPDLEIEANDISIFEFAKPCATGQLLNIYNESALQFLESKGVKEATMPIEIPLESLEAMVKATKIKLGVQVFGRMPLALSVRCYHARAHNLNKVNCNFVCGEDADGLIASNLENVNLFAINGTQTLSYNYCNLINELGSLRKIGVNNFRLSPHSEVDMITISKIFKDCLDEKISVAEANSKIALASKGISFSSGFLHGKPGMSFDNEDS